MTQTLNFSIVFEVPAKVIYNALIDSMEASRYTRCKAEIVPEVGGSYKIYEGKIAGKFISLEKDKKIIQEWSFSDWNSPSTLEITFKDREDSCKVEIKQSNVPANQNLKKLEDGWMQQIFKPMSLICGYPIEDD